MSTGYRLCFHILWITLQMSVFAYPEPRSLMANPQFTPYVSEFEYASRFHPSKNPECPTGWSGKTDKREENRNRRNFGSSRYRRSPEEGSPVGQEPSIEVRAILVRCAKTEEDADDILINRNVYNITAGRSQDILDFHGFDRDEPTRHSEVRDCRRKLIITMKFNNIGKTKTQEEFVVIDHVLDPVTMHKARLLNPFVVKVRQEPVLQLYGLKFQGVVNAEAREEVMNNRQANYTGCDDTSENPTCGQMIFEDKPIPHSQGFCCSCDPEVNIQRQASIFNETVVSSFPSFFSKTKDRSIRPFKSPRSVKANFIDDLSESDEINENSSAQKTEENDKLRSSYESLENLENNHFQGKFKPMKNNLSLRGKPDKDERDLKNVKLLTDKNEKMGISLNSKFDSSSLMSNSGLNNENLKDLADGRRIIETKDKNVIPDFPRNDQETLSSKPMMNLIDELTKLEEDYKNFRISSRMKAKERNDRVNDMRRFRVEGKNSGNGKYFGQRSNVDDTKKFRPIGSFENELFAKNNYDGRNDISTSRSAKKVPSLIDDMIYDRSSTFSINVKLAFVPRKKSTIRPVNSIFPSNICSKKISKPSTTKIRTLFESSTPAILWQKLASDGVYPSSKKNKVCSKNFADRNRKFDTTRMTTNSNEKFDNDVVDLLANVVMSDDAKLFPDNLTSKKNRSRDEENGESTIFENSITSISTQEDETAITSEPADTMDLRRRNDFTTSLDGISSHVENLKDSSSSFSSGNHTRKEAIVLSGSLKNQLGNWLTYDESKKHESRDEREKSKQDYGVKIRAGRRDESETKTFTSSLDADEKKNNFHENQTNITMDDRIPVEFHLGTNYEHESSTGIDEDIFSSKTSENDEKSLQKVSLDRVKADEVNFISRKKSKRSNFPRAYRSIADEDRFFVLDSERQKNIDKRIEHEFEEISDVLKDAADGKTIIREKAKSDENFEKDDSTMNKFGSTFDKIPKKIKNENDSRSHESSLKVDSGISRNERNRSKMRKVNGGSIIGRNSKSDSTQPATQETQVTASTVKSEGDRTEVTQISKHTEEFVEPVSEIAQTTEHRIIVDRFKLINEYKTIPENPKKTEPESLTNGFTNVSPKIRDLMEKDSTSSLDLTTTRKNEPRSEPISEIVQTTEHPVIVDRFKIVNEFRDEPNNDQSGPRQNSSNLSKFKNVLPKNRELSEKVSPTNNSFPNNSSPVFMIENLKKELRNEAQRYLPMQQSRNSVDGSNSRDVAKSWTYSNEAREVATDLTPAEKVEDSITDEETLPRDEETTPLRRTTNFPSSVTTHPFVDVQSSKVTIFPRFAVQSVQRISDKKIHSIPSKEINKVFLLIEESLPSSSASFHHLKNHNNQGKKIHHHRNRRNGDDKKRLGKIKRNVKRNVVTTTIGRSIVRGKSENENDEHPWYDTTIELGSTVLGGSKDATTKVSSTISTRAKEFVKNKKQEVTSTGRSKRNLRILSSSKFQSFYPKSSDFASMVENERLSIDTADNVDAKSKRDDAIDYHVNKPEDLIFYDYENEGENSEGVNIDDKRSLDNALPEETMDGAEPSEGWKEKMELLKLKKHADVLKEYLNWRHDVAPPENHEIPGYTTMISATEEESKEMRHFLTAAIFNVSDKSILPSTGSTYSTNTEDTSNTIEEETDDDTLTTSSQQNGDEQTIFSSTVESSLTFMLTKSSTNLDELDTAMRIKMPTGCFHNLDNRNNMTEENMSYDEENLTGRILPSCGCGIDGGNKLSDRFTSEFSKNIHVRPDRPNGISFSTSSKSISDNRVNLGDIENDLIVISAMEKNRLRNKNIRGRKENGKSSAKIYKIREEMKSDHRDRHHRSKKKKLIRKFDKIDRRLKRVTGRRLMSISARDERNDNYENDVRFEEGDENNYSANDENMDNSNVENDGEKLKIPWEELIDKIIRENTSDSWHFGNTTNSWSKDIPVDHRSVFKQLHINDADKYIKKIAKKIVHNSNIHDSKDDKDLYVDKKEVSRHRGNSDRRNRGKSHVVLGRKLKQYADKSMTNLRFKMEDSNGNVGVRSDSQLNQSNGNENSNGSSSLEKSGGHRNGRDYAISLSGKIHVEGGKDGQPMSISFDTSPDVQKTNEIFRSASNQTSTFDNQTKIAGQNPPSTNFLSSFFNIAAAPKESANNSPTDDKSQNSNVSLRQFVRRSDDDKTRPSRENHRQKASLLAKRAGKVRKSRAADSKTSERYSKYRDDRSDDLEDSQDIDEEPDADVYSEFSIDDENDSDIDDDSSVSVEGRNSDFESHRTNVDDQRSLESPKIRTIKIIPLEVQESAASSSSLDSSQEKQRYANRGRKINRMTASQLPKPNNQMLGASVKPGKIEPAHLSWRENGNFNPADEDFPGKSPGCCSSRIPDENLDKSQIPDEFPMDRRVSTMNPVNLKIIGLVGMKQPAMDEAKNLNGDFDSNDEMVPLIHVKIQQQPVDRPSDRNYIVPLRPGDRPQSPRVADCSKIVTSSTKNIGDSLCSRIHDIGDKIVNEDTSKNSVMPTLNMDNDEDLREPITPCPESEKTNRRKISTGSRDRSEMIRPSEETSEDSCHGNRKTPPITSLRDSVNKSDTRKKIRMKNMLAILEFMKKINKIMSGGDKTDCANDDYNDAVIKLERLIVFPNNRSDEISGRPEPEMTTNRVVVIGEGVKHDSPYGGISSEENLKLSRNKEVMTSNQNGGSKLNEAGSLDKSLKLNKKVAETDQDQSFLFYGKNDKLGASSVTSEDVSNENRMFNNAEHNETTVSSGSKEENISVSDSAFRNSSNSFPSSSDESPVDNEVSAVVDPREKNKSRESDVFQHIARKTDDRHHDSTNENLDNDEEIRLRKAKKTISNRSTNKRKAVSNDFSSVPTVKRRRSSNRSASYRTRDGSRDEREAASNAYRSKLSPSGGQLSRLGGEKFERLVAANGNNVREKRKKKRRRKKKKRRRKKKKRKKGKSGAGTRGKGWWPFGRQLMSLNADRRVILDSNFDRRQVERAKTKKRARRKNRFSLEQRKRSRLHRANNSHDKKKKSKKHHKHKNERKRKKKPKTRKKEKKAKKLGRNKRQIKPGGTQARGGQDCMNRRHPSNVDPAKYLESTHCLRFSDLWYSVYELESPIMEHTIYLQLFEKHSLPDGTTHWDDLTQGTMVRMGTFTRQQRDKKPTIVFTYSGAKVESQKRALNLDPARQKLLVPSPVPPNKISQYPAVRGNSGEYLVVQTSAISKDGNECDKAGVNFAAFTKQEDRCGRAKSSCLKNQPLTYWKHDMEARDSGRRGCYFLSNFASVPTNPIKYNVSGTGSREYLGLEYHSSHVSAIDIEVRTDYNAIVRVGSSGRVTEVYIDSTSLEHTVVTVVISNMGLASSPYQPRITDCPTGLPVSWTKAKGIMQVIPPQHDQRVTLDLYGQLLLNGFHCSVEVVNHRGELVAMRRIRVQKMDRCFCVWHCLCACIGSVSGMGCQPMSPEHYHAAGFQGPVPVISTETSILMNAVKDVLMLSALLVLLLLLLGLLKWFVGMFAPTVGRWGLDSLLQGSKIEKYFEQELRCRCIVTDDDGTPVHPDTGQRTVRLCSRKLEFILNLIFFLTYPIAMCCSYFRRSLQSSRQHRCCPDESKMCLINEKSSCPKMICVSTYGDSKNSRLEAEDTRYVMNELKKSQESLENPKGTKKKDGRRSDKTLTRKSSHKNKSTTDVNAKKLVDDLLKRRTVFRNLSEPIGGLAVPAGTTYSLRGYFLNAENGGYRFITPCPFKQHWLIGNNQKKSSEPPEIYPSNLFMRTFGTARDVYESNEISLSPKGVCVNVQYLEHR